jgi:hypothetical protein
MAIGIAQDACLSEGEPVRAMMDKGFGSVSQLSLGYPPQRLAQMGGLYWFVSLTQNQPVRALLLVQGFVAFLRSSRSLAWAVFSAGKN